jgi:hypothetical protein
MMREQGGDLASHRASVLLLAAILLAASGCASQPPSDAPGAPGFFMGLLHGFIALFSFVASWFTDVRIYAVPNSGVWYDLGYLLGVSAFFGGSGASSRRVR